MPDIYSTVHEGVKKSATLNLDINTTSDTIEIYAFKKNDLNDTGTLLATVSGAAANTDINVPTLDTHLLEEGVDYVIECWIDPNQADKQCVHPGDGQVHNLHVKDRRRIS